MAPRTPIIVGNWKLNKTIADELNVSTRTVEIHRAHVMEKMQAESLPALLHITNRIRECTV